jgi:hypothetical protein
MAVEASSIGHDERTARVHPEEGYGFHVPESQSAVALRPGAP